MIDFCVLIWGDSEAQEEAGIENRIGRTDAGDAVASLVFKAFTVIYFTRVSQPLIDCGSPAILLSTRMCVFQPAPMTFPSLGACENVTGASERDGDADFIVTRSTSQLCAVT